MQTEYDAKSFADLDTYRRIIGILVKNYDERVKYQGRFDEEDFVLDEIRVIIINYLINPEYGCKKRDLNAQMLASSLQESPYYKFDDTIGEYINQCTSIASDSDDMEACYEKVKKLAYLRRMAARGLRIDYFYDPLNKDGDMAANGERAERLEKASLEEVIGYFRNEIDEEERKFRNKMLSKDESDASVGLRELIQKYIKGQEVGLHLCGPVFSSLTYGARLGKLYLRSSASGHGKTRTSVFDACEIAIPELWHHHGNQYDKITKPGFYIECKNGKEREPEKVLFITTEMAPDEIRSIILAKISGVNEGSIKDGSIFKVEGETEEKRRVSHAINILEKYNGNLFLEQIENPDLSNVEAIIRKYVFQKNVKYVFFDYIFSSTNLITEINNSKIREDVMLGMMANKLKSLAVEHNIFIMTSTQVSAEGMGKPGFKNENCLRGAKSLADKTDLSCIISRLHPTEKKLYEEEFDNMPFSMPRHTPEGEKTMTYLIDIYKNRNGRHHIRIPVRIDLGTGEREEGNLYGEEDTMYPFSLDIELFWNSLNISYIENTFW